MFSKFSKASQQFNSFSPEMKEQMMKMAKARVREKMLKWLATPTFVVIGIILGAVIGALTACFGDISDRRHKSAVLYPRFGTRWSSNRIRLQEMGTLDRTRHGPSFCRRAEKRNGLSAGRHLHGRRKHLDYATLRRKRRPRRRRHANRLRAFVQHK